MNAKYSVMHNWLPIFSGTDFFSSFSLLYEIGTKQIKLTRKIKYHSNFQITERYQGCNMNKPKMM